MAATTTLVAVSSSSRQVCMIRVCCTRSSLKNKGRCEQQFRLRLSRLRSSLRAPAILEISSRATLYDILGIGEDVPDSEIKEAYRRLAKVYHPDVAPPELWPEHQSKFLEVQRAYDVLKDPTTRAEYNSRIQQAGALRLNGEWRGFNWETDQCW